MTTYSSHYYKDIAVYLQQTSYLSKDNTYKETITKISNALATTIA